MYDSKITSERFIALSREYVDDVMKDREIRITKEHYYIFAISNFIATKEHFLKKKIVQGKTKIIFNITDNKNIMLMIEEFYNSIKLNNKTFKEPSINEIKNIIEIIPTDLYDNDKYLALYIFHEIRNALSHAGNYEIKENNNESIVSIKNINSNKLDIPIELFDFIAFYINSYIEKTDVDEIFQNYLIYKESKDNKKYYSFESKNAINKIVNLLSKTQIRIKQKNYNLTRNRSGSNSEEYFYEVLDEFKYNYQDKSDEIIRKIEKANISDEQKLEILMELNIIFRANKRIASIKIDKCIENIKSILKLDKKSASLYSHSIILFTNREEPNNTNAQTVLSFIKKTKDDILSIATDNLEKLDNEDKKKTIEKYQQAIERILKELPNLMRINEHKYRNSIFHNNVKFESKKIYFWNQKDNTNPNDIHTFEISKTPEEYNSELKSIENYNLNVGEITIAELFDIFSQYQDIEEVNKLFGKLWNINQIDNELLKWNMSINDLLYNINKKTKELSSVAR